MSETVAPSPAPALSHGLAILELLCREPALTFNQLAQALGLNQSSLNRYLKVLLRAGYLHKDARLHYTLGVKAGMLHRGDRLWQPLLDHARPGMQALSARFGVTVLFVSLSLEQVIVLDKVLHPDNIAMQEPGASLPANLAAPWGILLMADLARTSGIAAAEKYLREHIPAHLPLNLSQVRDDIDLYRRTGLADDRGRLLGNMRRLAAPILNPDGDVLAAIGAGSFPDLLEDEKAMSLGLEMRRLADSLSGRMSGQATGRPGS